MSKKIVAQRCIQTALFLQAGVDKTIRDLSVAQEGDKSETTVYWKQKLTGVPEVYVYFLILASAIIFQF